jgi:hypothetical protein
VSFSPVVQPRRPSSRSRDPRPPCHCLCPQLVHSSLGAPGYFPRNFVHKVPWSSRLYLRRSPSPDERPNCLPLSTLLRELPAHPTLSRRDCHTSHSQIPSVSWVGNTESQVERTKDSENGSSTYQLITTFEPAAFLAAVDFPEHSPFAARNFDPANLLHDDGHRKSKPPIWRRDRL